MYHPHIYTPNSEKSVVKVLENSTNNLIVANDRIWLDSTSFNHTNASISNGQLVFTGGEHLLVGAPYATIEPISSTTETTLVFQWYDVTNSQFIGTQGRRVVRYSTYTCTIPRASICACYVNSSIIVELRCVSKSGVGVDMWDSYPINYLGSSFVYLYSPKG
jgi:hypothetical protein